MMLVVGDNTNKGVNTFCSLVIAPDNQGQPVISLDLLGTCRRHGAGMDYFKTLARVKPKTLDYYIINY